METADEREQLLEEEMKIQEEPEGTQTIQMEEDEKEEEEHDGKENE
jgi:hypothetical protein